MICIYFLIFILYIKYLHIASLAYILFQEIMCPRPSYNKALHNWMNAIH